MILAATSGDSSRNEKARIINSKLSFELHALFGGDREYSLQQVRISLQRISSGWEALVVDTRRCSGLICRCKETVFRCNEFV